MADPDTWFTLFDHNFNNKVLKQIYDRAFKLMPGATTLRHTKEDLKTTLDRQDEQIFEGFLPNLKRVYVYNFHSPKLEAGFAVEFQLDKYNDVIKSRMYPARKHKDFKKINFVEDNLERENLTIIDILETLDKNPDGAFAKLISCGVDGYTIITPSN